MIISIIEKVGRKNEGNNRATPGNCCNYGSSSRYNKHCNDGGIESPINSFMVIMVPCGGVESPKYDASLPGLSWSFDVS